MQFVVPIHSKLRTRRGYKGLSLVRSFNDDTLRSRTYSEFGTADFAEELARHSLLMMEEQYAQLLEEQRRR